MTRLLAAQDGCLYGLTTQGGPSNGGTIFRLTTDGVPTTLANAFGPYATDQGFPPLIQAADGIVLEKNIIEGIEDLTMAVISPV